MRAGLRKYAPGLLSLSVMVAALGVFWGRFLGSTRIGPWDWTKESYYLHVLVSSLKQFGAVPTSFVVHHPWVIHMPAPSQSITYWGNPEVVTFSPFLLFAFLPPIPFLKVYIAGHFVIAAIGLILLGRRLSVGRGAGVAISLALFILVSLNPWLFQHLTIGYTPYVTFCYWPILLVLLIDGRVASLAAAAAINALQLYEGGLHLFIWLNFALGLVVVLSVTLLGRKRLEDLAWFWGASVVLALPKLAAIWSDFGSWHRDPEQSYRSLGDLWGLVTDAKTPLFDLPRAYDIYGTNFYDGSLLLGVPVVALIATALVLHVVLAIRRRDHAPFALATRLLVASIAFVVLGWRGVWAALIRVAPVLSVEKYPFRFLFLASMLLIGYTVLVLAPLAQRSRAVAVWSALLLLAAVPGFYERAQVLLPKATMREDPFATFDLAAHLRGSTAQVLADEGAAPTVNATPSQVVIETARPVQSVTLPWMKPQFVRSFELDPGVTSRADGERTILEAAAPTRSFRLRARTTHRGLLGVGALLLFAALVVGYRQRRRLQGVGVGEAARG